MEIAALVISAVSLVFAAISFFMSIKAQIYSKIFVIKFAVKY